MSPEELEEDWRAKEERVCAEIKVGSTGIEWICVRKAHPGEQTHGFVRRWKQQNDQARS